MKTYSIKPLSWQKTRDDDWFAESIFGSLRVGDANVYDDPRPDPDWRFRYCVDEYYDEGDERVESVEAGKERAWEWYLGRLLPALVDAALPAQKQHTRAEGTVKP